MAFLVARSAHARSLSRSRRVMVRSAGSASGVVVGVADHAAQQGAGVGGVAGAGAGEVGDRGDQVGAVGVVVDELAEGGGLGGQFAAVEACVEGGVGDQGSEGGGGRHL